MRNIMSLIVALVLFYCLEWTHHYTMWSTKLMVAQIVGLKHSSDPYNFPAWNTYIIMHTLYPELEGWV